MTSLLQSLLSRTLNDRPPTDLPSSPKGMPNVPSFNDFSMHTGQELADEQREAERRTTMSLDIPRLSLSDVETSSQQADSSSTRRSSSGLSSSGGFYPVTPSQGLEIPRRYTSFVDAAFQNHTTGHTASLGRDIPLPRRRYTADGPSTTTASHQKQQDFPPRSSGGRAGRNGAPDAPRRMRAARKIDGLDMFEYADLIRSL